MSSRLCRCRNRVRGEDWRLLDLVFERRRFDDWRFPEVDSNGLITTSSRGALISGHYLEHGTARILSTSV